MIYTTERIRHIWSEATNLWMWQRIELAVMEAQVEEGTAQSSWLQDMESHMWDYDEIPVEHWREETERCGHEVLSFLRVWAFAGVERCHIGLTSNDLTDTALGWKIKHTGERIEASLLLLMEEVDAWSLKVGNVERLGRTHGQPAVATDYQHLAASWTSALQRAADRIETSTRAASLAKVSGPVGTYLHVSREVERHVANSLGLYAAENSTQVVFRDRLATWVGDLATAATTMEAIAVELRLLNHVQLGEVSLGDGISVTSSAMVHKRNPTRLERLTGLARIVRSAYDPICEGIVQWHERDMAHSSVERTLLPQVCGVVALMADELRDVFGSLVVNGSTARAHVLRSEPEILSHSMLSWLQVNGWGYLDARGRVSELLRENLTSYQLRIALAKDPAFRGFVYDWVGRAR